MSFLSAASSSASARSAEDLFARFELLHPDEQSKFLTFVDEFRDRLALPSLPVGGGVVCALCYSSHKCHRSFWCGKRLSTRFAGKMHSLCDVSGTRAQLPARFTEARHRAPVSTGARHLQAARSDYATLFLFVRVLFCRVSVVSRSHRVPLRGRSIACPHR